MSPAAAQPCPCERVDARGRRLALADCCGRLIGDFDGTPAPDAEALMRSRYTAYVLEDAPYLMATWHPRTRPAEITFEPGMRWLGLSVGDHRLVDASHAEVAFVARYRLHGRGARLQERSRFLREQGRWYYMEGDIA